MFLSNHQHIQKFIKYFILQKKSLHYENKTNYSHFLHRNKKSLLKVMMRVQDI